MIASAASRPANLLDQRFVPQPHPALAAEPVDSLALQWSLMLAGCDVYLSDLAPETLSQICERLRARHGLQMPAL